MNSAAARSRSRDRGIELGPVVAGQQQFEAVVPGVGDLLDADQPLRLLGLPPGHAADEAEAAAERDQGLARGLRHRRLVGPVDDRGQRPVDVGEDRGAGRLGPQRSQSIGPRPARPAAGFWRHGA